MPYKRGLHRLQSVPLVCSLIAICLQNLVQRKRNPSESLSIVTNKILSWILSSTLSSLATLPIVPLDSSDNPGANYVFFFCQWMRTRKGRYFQWSLLTMASILITWLRKWFVSWETTVIHFPYWKKRKKVWPDRQR